MQETNTKALDRYSYSKISTYKQCKFKFKLKYLDKNFLFSANIATDFGGLVHSIEEEIALAIQAGQPINYIALKNKWTIYTTKQKKYRFPIANGTTMSYNKVYVSKTERFL